MIVPLLCKCSFKTRLILPFRSFAAPSHLQYGRSGDVPALLREVMGQKGQKSCCPSPENALLSFKTKFKYLLPQGTP